MDPTQRKLMQVTLEDGAEADRLITLMGDKVEPRRDYISKYADFNSRIPSAKETSPEAASSPSPSEPLDA